jgi:2-polyprenyl-3-methyl-5-hydroxy-6-metoxy-1,4-benzoquinol methylase
MVRRSAGGITQSATGGRKLTAKERKAMRFGFGKNWSRFVRGSFSDQRVEIAKSHILKFLGRADLVGLDLLDIGCGSGLHSLAAYRAGARRIRSFDYDSDSVATTRRLWRHAGEPNDWTVERGDVLDEAYIGSLGQWPFVYCWGVLHHTGEAWKAIENAQKTVAPGGLFYLALYSADVQSPSEQAFWLAKKQEYNCSDYFGRRRMAAWYIWNYMMGKNLAKAPYVLVRMIQHRYQRGMSLLTDIHDWLGGWPMEYTHDQQVVDLLEQKRGFRLVNVATGQACTEFLFERAGSPPQPTNVKRFEAAKKEDTLARVR